MKTDTVLSMQIATMVPDLYTSTDTIFAACCPSENTTATEVNACLATLPVIEEEPSTTTTTVAATEPAVVDPVVTTTTATEAVPTPTTAPTSGSVVASVSLPVMIVYALFNYVM